MLNLKFSKTEFLKEINGCQMLKQVNTQTSFKLVTSHKFSIQNIIINQTIKLKQNISIWLLIKHLSINSDHRLCHLTHMLLLYTAASWSLFIIIKLSTYLSTDPGCKMYMCVIMQIQNIYRRMNLWVRLIKNKFLWQFESLEKNDCYIFVLNFKIRCHWSIQK
jgi:hypothetical protein